MRKVIGVIVLVITAILVLAFGIVWLMITYQNSMRDQLNYPQLMTKHLWFYPWMFLNMFVGAIANWLLYGEGTDDD